MVLSGLQTELTATVLHFQLLVRLGAVEKAPFKFDLENTGGAITIAILFISQFYKYFRTISI